MNNSDLEYENDLTDQLGWNEANTTQYEVPYTILKYNQIVEANNRVSIFDNDDYNVAMLKNDGDCENGNANPHSDDSVPDNGKVIRVISGRGRGGRSIYQRPGATQEYEDVTRYLRKVAPLGYSNAITENALRGNRLSKKANKENIEMSTLGSSNNSIKPNRQDEAAVKQISSSTTTSSNSSEYFDTKDELNSSMDGTAWSMVTPEENNIESPTNDEGSTTTAVPLSELLRKSREQHKKMRIQMLKNSNGNTKMKLVKPPDTYMQ